MEEQRNMEEPVLEVPFNENISSPAENQQAQNNNTVQNSSIIPQLERRLARDAATLQNLIQSGTLNKQQGQYYMSQLAKKIIRN